MYTHELIHEYRLKRATAVTLRSVYALITLTATHKKSASNNSTLS